MPYHVYLISCSSSEKKYVGITSKGYLRRFSDHKWHARKNGKCSALYAAIRKHRHESFSVKLLEVCNTFREANDREVHWIKELNTLSPNGYNLTTGGDAGTMSKETLAKMSKRMKGKPLPKKNVDGLIAAWANPEIRASRCEKIKEAMNRPEVRKQTSERQKGVKKSETHIKGIRAARSSKVKCVETGVIYEAIIDAVYWIRATTEYKKASTAKISRATKREDYTAYGYKWQRVQNDS